MSDQDQQKLNAPLHKALDRLIDLYEHDGVFLEALTPTNLLTRAADEIESLRGRVAELDGAQPTVTGDASV